MALKPITLLAAIAGIALISSQAKASTPSTTKKDDKKPPIGKPAEWVPPPPSLDDIDVDALPPPPVDLPNLPDVNDDVNDPLPQPPGDQPKDGQIIIKPNFGNFYGTYLINNDEAPAIISADNLWISQTCQSWGIGKNFEGRLPAKFIDSNYTDPEIFISPIEFWAGKDGSPTPHYIAHLPDDTIYRKWARNLIQYYSGGNCGNEIPRRKNYPSYQSFDMALQTFEETPIGQLYKTLYRQIGNAMYKSWASDFANKALEEDLRYGALWAAKNFPNLSVNDQTDEAYKKLFENDPKAPKILNPNNPAHKEYVNAWINLKQWIKGYIDLLGKYGNFKDPLE